MQYRGFVQRKRAFIFAEIHTSAVMVATLPLAVQMVVASNRAALAIYAGSSMSDPSLVERLATM